MLLYCKMYYKMHVQLKNFIIYDVHKNKVRINPLPYDFLLNFKE